MKLINKIRKLCTPAYVYLVISVVAMVAMIIQNGGKTNEFCVGVHSCEIENKGAIFIAQGLYTAFWVFVLDSICKAGHKQVSWFLVLLPYILLFIILAMFLLGNKKSGGVIEGFDDEKDEDEDDEDSDKSNTPNRKGPKKKTESKKDEKKVEKKVEKKDPVEEAFRNQMYQMIDNECTRVDEPQGAEVFSDPQCKNRNNIG